MNEKNSNTEKKLSMDDNETTTYKGTTVGKFVLSDKGMIPNETEQMKKEYHKQRLWQSKMAFWLSFGGSIAGFLIITGSVIYGMWTHNDQWPGIVSGIVVEAVAALFYTLSNKANEKISEFFKELTEDSKIKNAIELAREMEEGNTVKNQLYVKLSLHLSGLDEEKICKNTLESCNLKDNNT
jgi:hypothetical protein